MEELQQLINAIYNWMYVLLLHESVLHDITFSDWVCSKAHKWRLIESMPTSAEVPWLHETLEKQLINQANCHYWIIGSLLEKNTVVKWWCPSKWKSAKVNQNWPGLWDYASYVCLISVGRGEVGINYKQGGNLPHTRTRHYPLATLLCNGWLTLGRFGAIISGWRQDLKKWG